VRAGSLDSRTHIAAIETVNNYSNLMLAKNRIVNKDNDDNSSTDVNEEFNIVTKRYVSDNPPTPKRFERVCGGKMKLSLSDSDRSSSYIDGSPRANIRQKNMVQKISPPQNNFSLGHQSPQLRQTAVFNSIAARDRASNVGLDEGFEILRTSGKELMCAPYSIRSSEAFAVSSAPSHVSYQMPLSQTRQFSSHNINFITPLNKSKEQSTVD